MRESQIIQDQINSLGAIAELLMATHMKLSNYSISDHYRGFMSEESLTVLQELSDECERLFPLVDTLRASSEALYKSVSVAAGTYQRERSIWEKAKAEKEAYERLHEVGESWPPDYVFDYTGGFVSEEDWDGFKEMMERDPETGETIRDLKNKQEGNYSK